MLEAVGPPPEDEASSAEDGSGPGKTRQANVNRFEAPAATGRVLLDLSVDPQLIVVERRVGSGCFGDVYQGRFQGTRVAIKSLK
jgi:hypothetical protein